MNTTARLILEASTGILGPDAQILAEEWSKLAAQNEKLKIALELCVDHVSANSSSGREAIAAYKAATE